MQHAHELSMADDTLVGFGLEGFANAVGLISNFDFALHSPLKAYRLKSFLTSEKQGVRREKAYFGRRSRDLLVHGAEQVSNLTTRSSTGLGLQSNGNTITP